MGQGTQRVQVRGECQHHRAARYNHSMDIAVVGAGPAGIMAALQASRGGAQVTLFDHNARIGRKLLVTGSGRCNLTNENARPDRYHGEDPDFCRFALEQPELSAAGTLAMALK